jgi:dTDP-4-amino-4,6-dideoxygalactose transaminase
VVVPFFKKNLFEAELLAYANYRKGDLTQPRESVEAHFRDQFSLNNFYLTKSCTQALELAIQTLEIPSGREVILPSYSFVSLGNAVVLNGLRCVFVDCQPETMNICPEAIKNAITEQTAAVITINYGGISCDYDEIEKICKDHQLFLIEDNAHGIYAQYKEKALGTFGDISCISFDYLKNISCEEGGGISIHRKTLENKFQEAYQFGTNRAAFLRKETSSYEWKSAGTNAQIAEALAATLLTQLSQAERIITRYLEHWNRYFGALQHLEQQGKIQLAQVPDYARHNGHIFWMKTADYDERAALIAFLQSRGIGSGFHYTPLHSSTFGKLIGRFHGEDQHTTRESLRFLRLPLYYQLSEEQQEWVIQSLYNFYQQ